MASATPTLATGDGPKLLKKATSTDAKSSKSGAQTSFGCSHVKSLLQQARQPAVDGYTKIMDVLRNEDNFADRYYKAPDGGIAATCKATYLCLQCPNVSGTSDRHRKDHGFSVESSKGHVWCHECRDFVYDPTFEGIRTPNSRKRKRTESFDEQDERLVAANTTAVPCAAIGLRGIYNMGQTCFMSVVLQSLIHNPFIREYYLGEGHRSAHCDREACISCVLDELFNDFFGNEKHEGYGCVQLLWGCWKAGGGLAGYSQQDAHEFLGFILNSLHEADCGDDEPKHLKDCECHIHQLFGGTLKSTVTCLTCKNTTTALDPFMDLSLDVKTSFVSKKKKLALINGTQTVKEAMPMDLSECLDRFTSAETLSSDNYHCQKCNASREAKKKLELARLPPVVPIHLKRFSHSKSNAQSNKIDTRVRFGFKLDLGPYAVLSLSDPKDSVVGSESKGQQKSSRQAEEDDEDEDYQPTEPVYELSSVIVHKGKIDNGHYISYSRQGRDWFRFDDSMVVQVDEKEVLNAEAYMLFYVIAQI